MPDTNYNDTRCWDCQRETNHQSTDSAEWYMVWGHLWHKALEKGHADFLCIGCLENRLGRKLSKEDFNTAPLNSLPGYSRSKRLRNRLGIDH